MAMIFLCLDIQDATVESMSDAALNPEGFIMDAEQVIREALDVPPDKRVTLAPFRNGIVLSPDAARRAADSMEAWYSVADDPGIVGPFPEDREVVETIRAGLEVIEDGN